MRRQILSGFIVCAFLLSTITALAASLPKDPEPTALPDFDDAYISPRYPFGHDWITQLGGDNITAYGYVSDPSVVSMELATIFTNRFICPAPPPNVIMTSMGSGWFSGQFPGDYWLGTPTYDASGWSGIYVDYFMIGKNAGGTVIAEYPGPIGSWNYVRIYPAWPPTQINATSTVSDTTLDPGATFWVNGTSHYGKNCTYLPIDLDPGMTTKIPVELSNVTVTLDGTEFYGMTDIDGNYSIQVTAPIAPGFYMVNTTITNSTPNRNVPCVCAEIQIEVLGGSQTSHSPIRINSNSDFDEAHGVVNWATGNGTEVNPWIIEGWDINGTGYGYCLYIGNTTDYFEIRDCYLHDAGGIKDWPYYYDSGLIMYNTQNGFITNNEVNSNSYDGIFLVYSSNNNIIDNNTASYNENIGIYTYSSQFNNIMNNIASDNVRGITLSYSSNTTVTNNNASSNDLTGIDIFQTCEYNILTNNIISSNAQSGVYIYSSLGNNNMIYNNSFISNTIQAIDDGIDNSWHNGYPSGGNYWSDYSGDDLFSGQDQDIPGSDGIGDTNYTNIAGGAGAVDEYPLLAPFEYAEYNIPLQVGWNLISLPLIQDDEAIDKVLLSIEGKWDIIQTYDISFGGWITNSTFKPWVLNDLESMNHRSAYWLHIIEPDVNLTVKGSKPIFTYIPLNAGWNLVGYPSLTQKSILEALVGTGYDQPIVGFNAFAPYKLSQLSDTYLMKPGEGYWIHVPVDSYWVVDW